MADSAKAHNGRGSNCIKILNDDANSFSLGDSFAKREEVVQIEEIQLTNSGEFKRQQQLYATSDDIAAEYQKRRLSESEVASVHEVGSRLASDRTKKYKYFSRKANHWLPKLLIFLWIMGTLPGIDPSQISKTICKYMNYKDRCEQDLKESWNSLNLTEEKYCRGGFDNYICWPHTKGGDVTQVACPDFVTVFNASRMGYRFCQPNGSWYQEVDPVTGELKEWRHISDCEAEETRSDSFEDQSSSKTLIYNMRIMYSIGYAISLISLVIALLLLAFFKKLHCTRNYIHMNLMVSFILRYVVIIVKDQVIDRHYSLEGIEADGGGLNFEQLRQYCDDASSTGWMLTRCRLVITLMHYTITANYFWLLAEGLYLQMLLVFVMSENKYFSGFMVFGWGAPWISVLIWVVLRMNYENEGCWDMNSNMHIWWIIRAPIMASIVVNFCIFINIVRLIVSKLKAHNLARTDINLRLARSTLALIPLLGIHYMVFLAITEEVIDPTSTAMHLKLTFELFFSSIQGTLISILYCFLNNEVRAEVKRAWNRWRSRKDLPRSGSTFRKSSTVNSANLSTQITQVYSRHSTNGIDMPLSEMSQNSTKSSHSEGENKEETSTETNAVSNGYCVVVEGKNARNHKSFAVKSSFSHKNGCDTTNGDIECSSDVPFLRKD